jgi:hypothetical protein
MVIGCRQRGQSRVAVGSNGSRAAAGCRDVVRAGGGGAVRTGLIRATKVQYTLISGRVVHDAESRTGRARTEAAQHIGARGR